MVIIGGPLRSPENLWVKTWLSLLIIKLGIFVNIKSTVPKYLGKSRFLQYDTILKNALDMRPGTNIVGGSIGKKIFSSRFYH